MRRIVAVLALVGLPLAACASPITLSPAPTPISTRTPVLRTTHTFTEDDGPTATSTPTGTPTPTPLPTITPTPTPLPTVAASDFNERTALEALFGQDWVTMQAPYGEPEERIRWHPQVPPLGIEHPDFWNDPVYCKAYFSAPFRQNGMDKFYLLTQIDGSDPSLWFDGPQVIGVAVFSRMGDSWQIDAVQVDWLWWRVFRHMSGPAEQVVQFGPDKYGVLVTEGDWGTGFGVEYAFLVTQVETHFEAILFIDWLRSWIDPCDENAPSDSPAACYEYSSIIEFIPGDNTKYFDCRVITSGTTHQDVDEVVLAQRSFLSFHGDVLPFELIRTYSFSETEQIYVLTSQEETWK